MHHSERKTRGLVFGSLAVVLPALEWALLVLRSVRSDQFYRHQGGLLVTASMTLLAVLVWLACAVPAVALSLGGTGGPDRRGAGPGWQRTVSELVGLGGLVAGGTCLGPMLLAAWLRGAVFTG